MCGAEDKPVVSIPSLEELEKQVIKKLREEASGVPSEPEARSWEDFIDN